MSNRTTKASSCLSSHIYSIKMVGCLQKKIWSLRGMPLEVMMTCSKEMMKQESLKMISSTYRQTTIISSSTTSWKLADSLDNLSLILSRNNYSKTRSATSTISSKIMTKSSSFSLNFRCPLHQMRPFTDRLILTINNPQLRKIIKWWWRKVLSLSKANTLPIMVILNKYLSAMGVGRTTRNWTKTTRYLRLLKCRIATPLIVTITTTSHQSSIESCYRLLPRILCIRETSLQATIHAQITRWACQT